MAHALPDADKVERLADLGQKAVAERCLIAHVFKAKKAPVANPPRNAPRQRKSDDVGVACQRFASEPRLIPAVAGKVTTVVLVRGLSAVSRHDIAPDLDLAQF